MSGGVDSSVALYLMKEWGFDCTGIMLELFNSDGVEDARSVAHTLDIPFYVLNFTDDFKKQVIDKFVKSYQDGATPNPCVDCNRFMKFDKMFWRAKQLDIDYIVTGHYARIEYDKSAGRYLLKKAADDTKDQSYVLYSLTQEQLKQTLFPLGELSKSEVRVIADRQGFINAGKRDSQDICFVRDGDYADFIENYTGKSCEDGNFIDMQGNVLGRHKGLIRYTVGQRKGLGIALQKPMYVYSKSIEDNTVTLCENENLFTKLLYANDFNWIAYDKIKAPIRAKVKVRYKQAEQWAKVEQVSNGTVRIEFDEPQRAIARGQAAVLYDGDVVIGGGTITAAPTAAALNILQ